MRYVSDIDSPQGRIRLVADDAAIIAVAFHPDRSSKLKQFGLSGDERSNQISQAAARQLTEYFAGDRSEFDLPVKFLDMTPFAQTVLTCLSNIPYGEIISYGTLAAICERPNAARAVGRIMAANPIPIIIPCHRVVGSTGKMTGYSGGDGIETKEWLLAFENEKCAT